eukprot:2228742-Prymnesium_polylepis.2
MTTGEVGGDGGEAIREPQSVQSEPAPHDVNSAPTPPSSQSPSDAYVHVSEHTAPLPPPPPPPPVAAGGGDRTVGGGLCWSGDGGADGPALRGLQSVQSEPDVHELYSAPGPPSSQSPSEA